MDDLCSELKPGPFAALCQNRVRFYGTVVVDALNGLLNATELPYPD